MADPHRLEGPGLEDLGLSGKVPRPRRFRRRPSRDRGRWNLMLAVAASLSLVVPVLAITLGSN